MKKIIGIIGIIAVFAFSSCEIGLGKQVDVDPPRIQMELPTENARTRGSVSFCGTWTDDLEIEKVVVELKEPNSSSSWRTFIAETKNENGKTEGSWNLVLDTKNQKIPDGTYTVIAKAFDTYGHSSEVSTSITVDNTPPLIVLESPSTKDINSPMAYGKTFSIIGRGADEQNGGTVDSVDVIVYDESDKEVGRKTFKDISTSIDFSIADWNEDGDNFYKKIYGSDENAGTKNYYLELIAYDDAREVPAKEGDRGNSTNQIYLNNDLSVVSGFKPSIAYNIINGSLSRSAAGNGYSELESALNDAKNKITRLTFSLNPVNNPYFEVQNFESVGKNPDLDDEKYAFMNKTKLTVNIYVGRDKKQIRPETISVWLEPCDKNGKPLANAEKIDLLKKGGIDKDGNKTASAGLTEDFRNSASSCTWSSVSLAAESVENLKVGQYYLVRVQAEDFGGVQIANSSDYALKFTTVNAAPIMIITEPEKSSLTIAQSEAYKIKGYIKTSSKIASLKFSNGDKQLVKEFKVDENVRRIKDDEIAGLENAIALNESQSDSSLNYYNFAYEIGEGKITDGEYILRIVAVDESNQEAVKEITVENDVRPPEFDEECTITPSVFVEKDGKSIECVNGTITIAQLITDDRKVAESWRADAEEEPALDSADWKKGDVPGSSASNLKFKVDTTKFADNSQKTIWLKAKDQAGNVATGKIVLNINQSTDKPEINLTNAEFKNANVIYGDNWEKNEYETAKKNCSVFGTTSGNEILGLISDDDGIASVEVFYRKISFSDAGDKNLEEAKSLGTFAPGGKTTYSLKVKLPSEEGTYLITVKVKDSKGETDFAATETRPFLIAVDDGAPALEIKTTSDAFQKNTFEVAGTVSDKNAKLYSYSDKTCTENQKEIAINLDGTWKDEIKVDGAEGKAVSVWYKAEDDYGQSSVKEFKYKYDPKAPTFKVEKVQGDAWDDKKTSFYGTTNSNAYFVISGEVSDKSGGNNADYDSGFNSSEFYYWIGSGEPPKSADGKYYTLNDDDANGGKWHSCKITPSDNEGKEGKWNANVNFHDLKAGEGKTYKIRFAAKDDAGNISSVADSDKYKFEVTIDSALPEITEPELTESSSAPKMTIKVTEKVALDENSLKVLNNNAPFDPENYTKTVAGDNENGYTIEIVIKEGKVPVGENNFTFSVKDKAGNESATSGAITIINSAPVIENRETGINSAAYKIEKDGKQYQYINKAITASAKVTCAGKGNKLKEVKYEDKDENDAAIAGGALTSDANGIITIPAQSDLKVYENEYVTRTVTATNVYGQLNTWTYYFIADTIAPKLNANSTGDDQTQIGGKFVASLEDAKNRWFKTETLETKGSYAENGSGIKEIEYEITGENSDFAKKDGKIYASGKNGDNEKFSSIISGFAENKSALNFTLKATDNAGNVSAENAYVIKVDTTAPVLKDTTAPNAEAANGTSRIWYRFSGETTWNKYDNSILTNATKAIELTGEFEDKSGENLQSGVSEILIIVNGNNIKAKVYSKNDDTWSVPTGDFTGFEYDSENERCVTSGRWFATIGTGDLNGSGTNAAKITVKDFAGNEDSSTTVNFLVDKVSPTVVVEMPSKNSTLNGLNVFSGKVNDDNDVKSIELLYYIGENAPSTLDGFTVIADNENQLLKKDVSNGASLSDITSWKFDKVNVNNLLSGDNVSGTMWLLPVAYDKAGNCNVKTAIAKEDCTKITIDLNSDRPIIKFIGLSKGAENEIAYLNSENLNISLEDDDGIQKFEYSFDGSKWETATVNSGSVSIPLGEDGAKTLSFRITDTADGVFVTGDSKTYEQPYLKYQDLKDNVDNSAAITFYKDTTAPTLGVLSLGFGKTDAEATSAAKSADSKNKIDLSTSGVENKTAGGTERKYIVFEAEATDACGIKSVTATVSGITEPYKFTASEDDKYYSAAIDVSEISEGSRTVTFAATDKAGLSVTKTAQIIIDNSGPAVTFVVPAENDEQTGIVTLSGVANDEYSSVTDVRYLVLDNDYYSADRNLVPDVESKVREAILSEEYSFLNSGTATAWKFKLDGVPGAGENAKNALLPSSEKELEKYSNVPHTEKDIYAMTYYLYAKDSLGNERFTPRKFTYNPFGDRPKADITFPTGTEEAKGNVNGSIRITGSAQDNESVREVYVQIDMNKDGKFEKTDMDALAGLKVDDKPIYTIVTDTDYKTGDAANADLSAIGGTFWGIKANNTNSWNLTINQYAEMLKETNKLDPAGTKFQINIRAVAVDNNYKFGNWSTIQYVEIDNNIPIIGNHAKTVNEKDSAGNTLAARPYVTDMYLKGKAELELSVEDAEGIKQVMYYIANTEAGLTSAEGKKIDLPGTPEQWTTDSKTTKGYIVTIPLSNDASASGTKYVKVVATKNSDTETTAYEKFVVNFDNAAPAIPEKNGISLNGRGYDASDKKVVNSNGAYFTLGGTVTDEGGSGFDKTLFYFYREGKTAGRIYDPMINSGDETATQNGSGRVNIIGLATRKLGGQTLYGIEKKITDVGNDKRTLTIGESNEHIRAGGVVEIGGTWFTIEKVDGGNITLTTDATEKANGTNAFFAYAQVIDNTGAERTDGNGDLSSGDDGDGMAESIIKSLNTWNYDATIHSNYIPDGPVKIVIFAFDKAGNVSAASYDASVQNNAPRLTRVMLATDLNANGSYEWYADSEVRNDLSENATTNGTEFGEFAFYSTLNNSGQASNVATVTPPNGRDAFIAKNNLLVVPEFTGGNGELSYTYKIVEKLSDNSDADITTISDDGETRKFDDSIKIENRTGSVVTFEASGADNAVSKKFVLTNTDLNEYESWSGDKKDTKYLAATFWDSTLETTPGIDSCYALLRMPIIINVIDDTAPTATIIPFYWNSKDDGSFVYDEDGAPLGHIDLPDPKNADEKPGVSGIVYVEGTAKDDTRLSEIQIKMPDSDDAFETMATYADGKWTVENNAEFEVTDLGVKQGGHKIKWRLKIDMSPYGIGTDKVLQVKAIDAVAAESKVDITTQTTKDAPTPTYKMDFVPYIRSIYATDVGAANRSRLGKFPVRAGEDMTIEGMNFERGKSYAVNFYKTGSDGRPGAVVESLEGTISETGKIVVKAPEYSRWVEVVVDNIATKNNKNINGGYNIESGYLAQHKDTDNGLAVANKAGTNFWTDDRYISVWKVGEYLPGSINPHSGVIKKIDRYNSGSGAGGYSDSTGWAKAGQPGGGQLYKQDGYSTAVDPVNDMNDSYYAAISSDDLKLYGYVSGKTYPAHGDNIAYDSSEVAYVAPVDELDYTIVNGVPYYVMQDNGLGGSSGSVWGLGLSMMREGIFYDRTYFNPYGGNTIEESKLPYIVERQGYDTASHKRDSTTGYDSVLYQFKNPRITGWYNENDSLIYSKNNGDKTVAGVDYIYISYYDSYAKCLKYAAFRVGHRFVSSDNKYSTAFLTDWGKSTVSDNIDIVAEMTSSPNTKGNQPEQKTFDHMKDGASVVAGNETTSNTPIITEIAGEWSDIFVDVVENNPRPVIVYYNKTKKTLEVAYGNNKFPQSKDDWTISTNIKPNGVKADFGRYVSAAMDAKGNLHVSAQDADNAKLYYLYLVKSGQNYTVSNSVAVDASNGAGRWTDIELTNREGENLKDIKPVISYVDTSYLGTQKGVKVAWLDDVLDGGLKFEAMTDPANYSSSDQRTSVMAKVKENKTDTSSAPVAVGFNSDMYAIDFLRGEQ